ncbi:MAG: circadian clock protein KaiB [Bradymonadaceae bacterium]|nr:circadian clock protein KaiB [Lujinxingiaceae bacterium]
MNHDFVRLRLYVAGDSPNSQQARKNLQAFCEKHLVGCHVLEIVDVLLSLEQALEDGILMTPALVILSASPLRTVIGTLSDPQVVLNALQLAGIER